MINPVTQGWLGEAKVAQLEDEERLERIERMLPR